MPQNEEHTFQPSCSMFISRESQALLEHLLLLSEKLISLHVVLSRDASEKSGLEGNRV